jgi:hypothetical protein
MKKFLEFERLFSPLKEEIINNIRERNIKLFDSVLEQHNNTKKDIILKLEEVSRIFNRDHLTLKAA